MQMLLITHADMQNANICFSIISSKTNVYQKNLYALMYKCDIFWQEIETNTNLSVSHSFVQILAQWAHVFAVQISFTFTPVQNNCNAFFLLQKTH